MDVVRHNQEAWNRRVRQGNAYTLPVTAEVIAAARRGAWSVNLTPQKPVPRPWFGDLTGAKVLGLASAGGQQAPILALAGANVTVFDLSPEQLATDRRVAEREGLQLDLQQGDMADLSRFAEGAFDLIFHPVSNTYIPDVLPVWREAYRVLRPGGRLLAGFINPLVYLFDLDAEAAGEWTVRNRIPYSDLNLPEAKLQHLVEAGETIQYSHTLSDQIGGQLKAGFLLADLYEDRHR